MFSLLNFNLALVQFFLAIFPFFPFGIEYLLYVTIYWKHTTHFLFHKDSKIFRTMLEQFKFGDLELS